MQLISKYHNPQTYNLRLIYNLRPMLVIETHSQYHPVSTMAAERPLLQSDAKKLGHSIILY